MDERFLRQTEKRRRGKREESGDEKERMAQEKEGIESTRLVIKRTFHLM